MQKKIKNFYFSHSKVAADVQKKKKKKIKYFYFSHSKVAADVQKKNQKFLFFP